jgi:hypothetical protein
MKHNSTTLQEDVMNKKHLVLAALMIFAMSSLLQAQYFYPVLKNFSASKKEQMDKIYADCLSTRHNGIIEGALAIVTMMKLDLPADEFPMIKSEIDDLTAYGPTAAIRYKAYLAEAVFANPAMFKEEATHQYSNPETFFSALAERMAKTLLSSI